MSNQRMILPIALIALLLGGGIGFFAGQMLSEPEPNLNALRNNSNQPDPNRQNNDQNTNPGDATNRPNSNPNTKPADNKPTPNANSNNPAPLNNADAALKEAVARALAALPPETKLTGTGEFNGTATELKSGTPLAGILIEAYGQPKGDEYKPEIRKPIDAKPNTMPDLSEIALNAIKESRKSMDYYFHATTAADGSYTIPNLPDMKFWISARGPGYKLEMAPGDNGEVPGWGKIKPTMTINFHGTKAWDIPVDVLMPDGSPAKPLNITIAKCPEGMEAAKPEDAMAAASNDSHTESWAGAGDFLGLEPGVVLLVAYPDNKHGMVKSETVMATVGEGGASRIVIQLTAVPGIALTTKDESEISEYSYCEKLCALCEDGVVPNVNELRNGANTLRGDSYWGGSNYYESKHFSSSMSFSGNYYPGYYGGDDEDENPPTYFKDLKPGRYIVALVRHEKIVAHQFADVSNGTVEVTLTLPPPARSEYALVWVKTPDGEMLKTGVNLYATVTSTQGSQNSNSNGSRNKEGAWTLRYPTNGDEGFSNDAKWSLSATHHEYGTKAIDIRPGNADEFTITFDKPCFILVSVDGLENHPAKDQLFVAQSNEEDQYYSGYDRSKPINGIFKIGPMQPTTTWVSLRISGNYWQGIELAKTKVVLSGGNTNVRMTIPPMYGLTVICIGGEPGNTVTLQIEHKIVYDTPEGKQEYTTTDQVASTTLDRTGNAKFENLPAGKYSVYIQDEKGRYDSTELTLPGAGTLTITPRG